MPLNPRIVAVMASIVVVTVSAVGLSYVAGAGPFQNAPAPELTDFETVGAECATDNGTGLTVEVVPGDGETYVTIDGAATVPDLAHELDNASVERTGQSNYTFSVESIDAGNGSMGAMCVGVIEYTADLTIPEDANATFSVAIVEDGDQIAVVQNGPDGSGLEAESGTADGDT